MIDKFAQACQDFGYLILYATVGFTMVFFGILHILVEFLLGRRAEELP